MVLRLILYVVAVFTVAFVRSEDREAKLVHATQGPVRGYKEDGLFVFHSIPYATAPTGVHKFKAPLPAPTWSEPLEAVDKSIVCPQANYKFMNITFGKKAQEDCLLVNVYAPDTKKTNLPVVVYVHGGSYQVGYGDMFTPKALVKSKKIIAVTFNYRLGIHGFLCLGTKEAPGNAGMKDQVALLRWVKNNIASFGGNPNDITLDGYSAGSSAVDLLQLSKVTRGLFNKMILESGANVAVWSIQLDPIQNAKDYARKQNFVDVDDIYKLEQFYTTAPLNVLTTDTFIDRTDSNFVFSPCVERETGVEKFLEDTPVNILKEGKYNKLPMLYGFSNMEGLFRVPFGMFDTWQDKMNDNFSAFLPADLQFRSEEQKKEVTRKIKMFYFGDKAISQNTILEYVQYFTDVIFAYPILRSVKLQTEAGNNKIYLYEYSFVDKEKTSVGIEKDVRGADHCAQTAAVLDGIDMTHKNESSASESLRQMKSTMREIWLNFITTSKPVPDGSSLPTWPTVQANRGPHMSLGETLQLRGPLLERRARFWDEIYERHYRSPIPPPAHPPRPYSNP